MTINNDSHSNNTSAQEVLAQIIGARVSQSGDYSTPIAGLGFFDAISPRRR